MLFEVTPSPADYGLRSAAIHRPQQVGEINHIPSCGSPIPLVSTRPNSKKCCWIDLDAEYLPNGHPAPCATLSNLSFSHWQPASTHQRHWRGGGSKGLRNADLVGSHVAEDDYLSDLPSRIEALTEGWPVEELRIRRQRGNSNAQFDAEIAETLDELQSTMSLPGLYGSANR